MDRQYHAQFLICTHVSAMTTILPCPILFVKCLFFLHTDHTLLHHLDAHPLFSHTSIPCNHPPLDTSASCSPIPYHLPPIHPTPMCRRFVLNQPAEELASFERILFAVEQAHWFYEDVTRETDPNLRTLPLKDFMHLSIPTLHTSSLPPYLFCFYMWKYDCLMFRTMAVYVRIYVYSYIIVFIV